METVTCLILGYPVISFTKDNSSTAHTGSYAVLCSVIGCRSHTATEVSMPDLGIEICSPLSVLFSEREACQNMT